MFTRSQAREPEFNQMADSDREMETTVSSPEKPIPQHDIRYQPGPSSAADAVGIKLQEFWTNDPTNWFRVAEIHFSHQKVSDKQKYLLTLSALSPAACKKIDDFLQNPPTEYLYEALKSALLDRLAPSDERKLETLLSGQELGDGRPSEILRSIRALANNTVSDQIIRSLWVRRLPPIIKTAIVGHPATVSLDELKRQADRIYDFLTPEQQVCEFSRSRPRMRPTLNTHNRNTSDNSRSRGNYPTSSMSVEDRLSRIEAAIQKLASRTNNGNNYRGRSSSRNRTRSSTPHRNARSSRRTHYNGVCYYHHFFGNRAKDCNKPCQFERGPSHSSVDDQSKN